MYKKIAVNKRRANGRYRKKGKPFVPSALLPVKRAKMPFSASNYVGRGRGRVVQAPRDTEQVNRIVEGRLNMFEKQANKNLTDATRDITKDIWGLNQDRKQLNARVMSPPRV